MPHFGHASGPSLSTPGHIGQVHFVADGGTRGPSWPQQCAAGAAAAWQADAAAGCSPWQDRADA
ncbi:MAG: hypothetical protein AB7Q81_22295 [Gammaproteobacteria bacterium]